jgi:hypothetical protein
MIYNLVDSAIVDSFKSSMKEMKFIDHAHRKSITNKLDLLCDKKIGRFRKSAIAADLWKYFLKASLGAITDNLRGCRELNSYFDEYCKYEELLFAIDD